jgi:signal transduction histidine kinase/ActR/RegA family two-component response regulator
MADSDSVFLKHELLVFAPSGRDAVLATQVLEQGGMRATICRSPDELVASIAEGAGAALVAQEALSLPVIGTLAGALRSQAPWSDFPLIIFMPRTASAFENRKALEAFADLGNVTALEKPIHPLTMVSAARAALRARTRQYAARAALEERERDVKQRDQFLALLGHELRNPLGALRNASKLLERDAAGLPRVPNPLAIIERQIDTLTLLVDDLLDVARVTSGKISLKPSPVDLAELVRNLVDEAGRSSRERRLQLTLDAPVFPVVVMGDRLRLEQVINNLLTNALKYTPPGGRIEVSLSSGEPAILRVVDTGVGISAEVLPTIFEPFTQASQTLDRSQGGMGLGLSVVRALVRLHGGEVVASSAGAGRGAEFTVRLPGVLDATALVAKSNTTAVEAPLLLRHILIVEDSDDNRESLQELLESEGHRVDTAADGEQGVERAIASHPDVALVDIGLPRLDGYEVARRIRAAMGTDIFLVALTGYGQPEDRTRAAAAGFDVHITKPIDFGDLSEILSAAAKGRAAFAAVAASR